MLLAAPLIREGIAIGVIIIRRTEVAPFHGEADQPSQNFRSPGRDRHRERAALQRIARAQRGVARGPGASDGDGRSARHHQPLADGRAAGLDAIVESAARVCGIDDVVLRLPDEGKLDGPTGSLWSRTNRPRGDQY